MASTWICFRPSAAGPLDESRIMGTSLTSLAPHLQKILMIRGLDNHAGASQGDGQVTTQGTSTFLTCVHPRKHESDVLIGPSVDQLLANHYTGETQFRSIEIGCEGGGNENACDSGYSCAYSRNISWRDARTPNAKETSPRLLFQRLFGVTDPARVPQPGQTDGASAAASSILFGKIFRGSVLILDRLTDNG